MHSSGVGTLTLCVLFALAVLTGCNPDPRAPSHPPGVSPARSRANAAFAADLEHLGYFKGLSAEQVERQKRAIEREGWTALFGGPPHRLNPADAEDLAEGGIPDFISLIRPFLLREKVRIPEIRQDYGPAGYRVTVGERTYVLYTREEKQRDTSGEEPGLTHGLSMVRGFALVNDLLAGARSDERLYAVGGGNNLFGMFLTPELKRRIVSHPDADPESAPYEPNDGYPTFGQPFLQDLQGNPVAPN